jgi:hypothetical protein
MPLEDVPQQSASSIDDDIDHLRMRLQLDVTQMKERFTQAEAAIVAAQIEFAAAQAAVKKAETRYAKYLAAFAEDVEAEAALPPVVVPTPVVAQPKPQQPKPAVAPKANGATHAATPSARASAKRGSPTVPERVAAAMGDGVWDAGGLEKVLANMPGEDFKSNNLRGYVSGILSGTKMPAPGLEGLFDNEGKPRRAHRFTKLERGQYRVATPEDIQNEVREIQLEHRKSIEANEAIVSENATTPADELFAEQGIDIRAIAQH